MDRMERRKRWRESRIPRTYKKFREGLDNRIKGRRRRARRPVKVLPFVKLISAADILTLLNFIMGVLAVMISVDRSHGFRLAMLFIVLGVVFDGLDGPIARRLGTKHRFGVWLDSIADSMTFCIAPSILVYEMFRSHSWGAEGIFQTVVVVLASLSISVLGILRLARFAISHHKWKDFIGMPTPAMALIVVSFCSFFLWSDELGVDVPFITEGTPVAIPLLLLVISFSMIADILYRKFRGNVVIGLGLVISITFFSLLAGGEDPRLGMAGSIVLMVSTLTYLLSPVAQGHGRIWGASSRMAAEEIGEPMAEKIEEMITEEENGDEADNG